MEKSGCCEEGWGGGAIVKDGEGRDGEEWLV